MVLPKADLRDVRAVRARRHVPRQRSFANADEVSAAVTALAGAEMGKETLDATPYNAEMAAGKAAEGNPAEAEPAEATQKPGNPKPASRNRPVRVRGECVVYMLMLSGQR